MNLKTHKNKKSNFLLYTVEGDTPFIYYHMIKTVNQIITFPSIYLHTIADATHFMNKHFTIYFFMNFFIY